MQDVACEQQSVRRSIAREVIEIQMLALCSRGSNEEVM